MCRTKLRLYSPRSGSSVTTEKGGANDFFAYTLKLPSIQETYMLEVEYLSDRVALIKQGEIIETGAPDELKQKHGCRNLEEVFLKVER